MIADRSDNDPGPAWFQFIDRHPLLLSVLAVVIGACPFLWRSA